MNSWKSTSPVQRASGFTLPDLLVTLAVFGVLGSVLVPVLVSTRAKARQTLCAANLQNVTRAVLMYADEHRGTLPLYSPASQKNTWWWYKEQVKSFAGLTGPSSSRDKVFACPNDRGYDEAGPFCLSAKFVFTSYVFNGVNLPGLPNIAGRTVSTIKEPGKTLLAMEFTAHAPLSWHRSRTGQENHPFYNNAESMVGFVDGSVKFIPIYYDGLNAAYTRDPIPGYQYKFSGD